MTLLNVHLLEFVSKTLFLFDGFHCSAYLQFFVMSLCVKCHNEKISYFKYIYILMMNYNNPEFFLFIQYILMHL